MRIELRIENCVKMTKIGDDIYMTNKLVSECTYGTNSFQVGERVSVQERIGTYKYIPQYMIYSGIYKETRIINGGLQHYVKIDNYDYKSKWYADVGKQKETVSCMLLKKALLSHPNMPLALAKFYSEKYGEHKKI